MTGYQSKKAAAHDKLDEDDDIQVYKRPWVGLTIEEIASCCRESTTTQLSFYNAIEAKLREKNT
jgi:hypothetical protein